MFLLITIFCNRKVFYVGMRKIEREGEEVRRIGGEGRRKEILVNLHFLQVNKDKKV